MLFKIILFFVVVPFVELALLLKISSYMGPMTTLALIIVTGIIGGALARWQGTKTLWRLRDQVEGGGFPTDVLADGAMILFAAALLLTPGILTDAFGFSLLTPVCRPFYRRLLVSWFRRNVKVQTNFHVNPAGRPDEEFSADPDKVIDAEVVSRTKENTDGKKTY